MTIPVYRSYHINFEGRLMLTPTIFQPVAACATLKRINHTSAPLAGSGLVFNVGIDTVEQAFTAQFRQLAVKIFPGLAEKFIRAIAEAKHGKCGVFQLRRFFGEQELMQRDGFFR